MGRIMQINVSKLKRQDACQEGLDWLEAQGTLDLCEVVKRAIAQKTYTDKDGDKHSTMDFAGWGINALMDKDQRTEWGIYCARQVEHLWKNDYPKEWATWDKWASGKNRSEAAKAAAGAAAGDAWAAAGAAAGDAWAAAGDKMLAKLLRYGVKILAGGGK
jgi:hypothetical protein